ncbi:MAG: glycogen synthase [Anaerolineae bacterium]|nr:glycogen synthase [Anaerolineae bacterium]
MTKTGKKTLRILFISAEADPFIKVGGLGDVAYALPKALHEMIPGELDSYELDIRIAIPCHAMVCQKTLNSIPVANFVIPHTSGDIPVKVFQTQTNDIPVYFFSGAPVIPSDSPVYSGDNKVDGQKYFFFSLAVLEFARQINWQPDILHANDWHTAVAVYKLSEMRQDDPFYKNCHSILTIHNLPYMGTGSESELEGFGISPTESEALPEWARNLPLPMGLLTADQIVAVSPTYATEILTPEFGCGLQSFLKTRESTVSGIINGIDQSLWNPETDEALPTRYTTNFLDLRRINKEALFKEFEFNNSLDIPLIALISRLDPQKGVDIAIEALRQISDLPWVAILLGTGYSKLEEDARKLSAEFPNQVRAAIKFDVKLSRRIYGGADMLMMPSRYEPCGLAQMIAMRYGCIPIARATGGLKDSIVNYSEDDSNGTGFLFKNPIGSDLAGSLTHALSVYEDKTAWKSLQLRAMQQDFSWKKPALSYANLYLNFVNS